MGKKLTLEEIKELYENENIKILAIEIRDGKNRKNTYVNYKCINPSGSGLGSAHNLQFP